MSISICSFFFLCRSSHACGDYVERGVPLFHRSQVWLFYYLLLVQVLVAHFLFLIVSLSFLRLIRCEESKKNPACQSSSHSTAGITINPVEAFWFLSNLIYHVFLFMHEWGDLILCFALDDASGLVLGAVKKASNKAQIKDETKVCKVEGMLDYILRYYYCIGNASKKILYNVLV